MLKMWLPNVLHYIHAKKSLQQNTKEKSSRFPSLSSEKLLQCASMLLFLFWTAAAAAPVLPPCRIIHVRYFFHVLVDRQAKQCSWKKYSIHRKLYWSPPIHQLAFDPVGNARDKLTRFMLCLCQLSQQLTSLSVMVMTNEPIRLISGIA